MKRFLQWIWHKLTGRSYSRVPPISIAAEVAAATSELERLRALFGQVNDPAIIDTLIYQIKAQESYLSYLHQNARNHIRVASNGISLQG